MSFVKSILLKKYNSQILERLTKALKELVPNCGMPLYTSIDLRDSGTRLVAVDVNLFPAGFNNLSPSERVRAEQTTKEFFTKYHTAVKRILIIAEDHTRNLYYLENLDCLKNIIRGAGFEVCVTNLATIQSGEDLTLKSASGLDVTFKPAVREGLRLKTKCGFDPDFILLNNDLMGFHS